MKRRICAGLAICSLFVVLTGLAGCPRQPGVMQFNISPSYLTGGWTFSRSGYSYCYDGMQVQLDAGKYFIHFTDVRGWIGPKAVEVEILPGKVSHVVAEYKPDYEIRGDETIAALLDGEWKGFPLEEDLRDHTEWLVFESSTGTFYRQYYDIDDHVYTCDLRVFGGTFRVDAECIQLNQMYEYACMTDTRTLSALRYYQLDGDTLTIWYGNGTPCVYTRMFPVSQPAGYGAN